MTFAYLDPGTGSLVLQALLGGAAGLAVLFRSGYARFRGKKQRDVGSDYQGSETAALDEAKEQSSEM